MSDAGTSLKTMILNLIPQTKAQAKLFDSLGVTVKGSANAFFDAHGNMKSMSAIAQVLQDKLKGLTNEQRIATLQQMFGTDALRAANILYEQGSKGINDMWAAMSKVKAADVAKVKLETLKGSFTELTSSLESVGIKIGMQFLPMLTQITRKANDVVGSLTDVKIANIEGALAFVGTAAGIAFVGTSIVKLINTLKLLYVAMGPEGWLILGLSLLGGLLAGAAVQSNALNDSTLKAITTQIDQQRALEGSIKQYEDLRMKSHLTNDEFGRFVDINKELQRTTDTQKIADLTKEQDELRKKSGLSNEQLDTMVKLNGDLVKNVPKATTEITKQGNAILNTTDSLKKYNKEKLNELYQKLDLQRLKTESQYRDELEKEKDLIEQIKRANKEKNDLIQAQADAQHKVNLEESTLNDMKAKSKLYSQQEIDQQRTRLTMAKDDFKLATDRLSKQAGIVEGKQKELDETQKTLQKIESIKDQMASILLVQNGLTSKKGEEIKVIDSAIAKLQAQKKTLEDTTPIAKRNTSEYLDAVSAIDQQIGKLQTTKSKIEEITGEASKMNAELAKTVNKSVNVRYTGTVPSGPSQAKMYHTGGITGRGQMPMLHVGGLASQFASLPNHNEVDVRLLRNEMVLTESQQANLMRMIDAGFTKSNPSPMDNNEILSVLDEIRRNTSKGLDATVVMDSYTVGKLIEKHVTDAQNTKQRRKEGFS